MDRPSESSSAETFHGWKEIAAHFDRTVRSVQRWERTLGLPIRRIATPEGRQIVYAYRLELDDWRRRMDGTRIADAPPTAMEAPTDDIATESVENPARDSAEQVIAAGIAQPEFKGRSKAIGIVVALLALSLAMAFGMYAGARLARVAPPPRPSQFEFVGTELWALDRDGRRAWTYDFGESVGAPFVQGVFEKSADQLLVKSADLDGDGSLEFIIPIRRGPPGTYRPETTDEVVAFSNDGQLLWSLRPETELSLAGQNFTGPWYFRAVAVSNSPGQRRTWAAFSHAIWSPGLVFEVSSSGVQSLRYVQSGWVTSLSHWSTPSGQFLAIGGVNNDHERPALALLHDEGPGAQFPRESGVAFECTGCSEGRPAAYFLFPNADTTSAEGVPYAFVEVLDGTGDNLLAGFTDARMAFVLPDLSARTIAMDAYWAEHRRLEAQGRISHSAELCPERDSPGELRRWTPLRGWVSLAGDPE